MTKVLVFLSALFSVLAYLPYIRAIIKTKNSPEPMRPNRASWFVWAVIDIAMTASLTAAHSYSVVPMFAAFSIGSTVIFILSIKYGEGGLNPLDLSCVAAAIIGLVLWKVLGTPVASIAANMLAATAGAIPTFVKGWRKPQSEDLLTWVLFTTGGLFNSLAVREFTFVTAGPPFLVFGIQLLLVLVLLRFRIMRMIGVVIRT